MRVRDNSGCGDAKKGFSARILQIYRLKPPNIRRISVRVQNCCLIVIIVALALTGCNDKKTETPRTVAEEFHVLLDSVGGEPPEIAADRLQEFLREYGDYQVADSVQLALDHLGEASGDRYHEARELARQGEFDRAQKVLEGLVEHFPETPAGENAARYLEYEFYFGKAQWLLVRQRYEESGAVARALLEHDLTPFQTDQVEQILDNVGYIDAAYNQSERFAAKNACRQLSMMLAAQYAMEGQYPSRLSLDDARNLDPYSADQGLSSLSAIEDYKGSDNKFSFVGVSKSGKHRIRVVNGKVED